ncbi:hypothetical protein ASD40_07990 [Paenibacillus sp. Root444D2]|nr:hypothetical protein ASD40_07990 [Paenibacillus sp. Root444D2]
MYNFNVFGIDFIEKTCDNKSTDTNCIAIDDLEGSFVNRINQVDTEEFDMEWVNLIMSARKMGLTMEDIRAFLRSPFQPTTISLSTENDRFMSSKEFIKQSS